MRKLPVRAMLESDLLRVSLIDAASQPSPWSQDRFAGELALPQSRLTVAEKGGRVVGYLCAWEVAGELEIQNIVTALECRRCGVATALLEELLTYARSVALSRLLLEVRSGNDAAIALYRRYGFHACGVRHGYYADGDDALLMERLLP